MFNAKPKQGLAFLEESGIITFNSAGPGSDGEKRTKAIARFLRQSTRLDKKLLGESISRPDQIELLKAFIGLFDFRGVSQLCYTKETLMSCRNRLRMLCGSCWRRLGYPGRPSRSPGSPRHLPSISFRSDLVSIFGLVCGIC